MESIGYSAPQRRQRRPVTNMGETPLGAALGRVYTMPALAWPAPGRFKSGSGLPTNPVMLRAFMSVGFWATMCREVEGESAQDSYAEGQNR